MGSDTDRFVSIEPSGTSRRVFLGIINDLEARRMAPGQRLAETDLATRFEVGRNAVREAIQHLAAKGIVDLRPNCSPAIRQLDVEEALEVLDVAEVMTGLLARSAARRFRPHHEGALKAALAELHDAAQDGESETFYRARRLFYRCLLTIAGNRELQRLYPAIGMNLIHAQYPSTQLLRIRLDDYQSIAAAVMAGDGQGAERAAQAHVDAVRSIITSMSDQSAA